MIKAIIFDYFGVLVTEGYSNYIDEFIGNDTAKLNTAQDLLDQLNRGDIDYERFVSEISKITGMSERETKRYLDSEKANRKLLGYIKTGLKPNYKIGILSNAGGDWVEEQLGVDAQLFDEVVLSYKVGMIKPNPKIYELICQKLDVKPSECIYIDDSPRSCDGAAVVGMQTVLFTSTENIINSINALLADSNH